jgi:polyhydroxyalkanoate synthesis regulator phasin
MKIRLLKFTIVLAMLASIIQLPATSRAYASEIDILVRKLVDKGVLTPGEAQQVLNETKEEVKINLAKGEAPGSLNGCRM